LRRRYIWFIVLAAWCVGVYFLTALPVFNDQHSMKFFIWTGMPKFLVDFIDFMIRKLAHVTLFAGLAFVAFQIIKPARRDYLLAWGFATLYAVSDEWHQLYVIGRTGSIRDVIIDSCGAFLVLLVIFYNRKGKTTGG
jgi:VanZ family protein